MSKLAEALEKIPELLSERAQQGGAAQSQRDLPHGAIPFASSPHATPSRESGYDYGHRLRALDLPARASQEHRM